MNSATGASAAHTAGSGASILTEIAESTLPLILALHTLRMPAPRTRQTQRKDFATGVGAWFWHYRHGRAMFSTTSVCAAITAVVGTMCSTTGVTNCVASASTAVSLRQGLVRCTSPLRRSCVNSKRWSNVAHRKRQGDKLCHGGPMQVPQSQQELVRRT